MAAAWQAPGKAWQSGKWRQQPNGSENGANDENLRRRECQMKYKCIVTKKTMAASRRN